MSKTYSEKIYEALKENKIKSLSILLEQDEENDKSSDTESSDTESSDTESGKKADDIFSALDDDESENKEEDEPQDASQDEPQDDAALDDETLKQIN